MSGLADASSARAGGSASNVLPQRQAQAAPMTPRLPLRVLQTSHAPAQLSLFLRPGPSTR